MRLIRGFFTFVGAVVCLALLGGLGAAYFLLEAGRKVAEKTVLVIDFEDPLVDTSQEESLLSLVLEPRPAQLRNIIEALRRAATDERIVGLLAKTGDAPLGMARIQEVRDAVLELKKSGKATFAYTESFGEFGPGNRAYYLSTAFDNVFLQPSGNVSFTGITLEAPFLKGTLDKLGVEPRLDSREEYKDLRYMFTATDFDPAQKEALGALIQSLSEQIVAGVANGRELPADMVREVMEQSPLSAKQALDHKLVDGLLYRDQVYSKVKEQLGPDIEFLSVAQYFNRLEPQEDNSSTVALIYGVGEIRRGSSEFDPLMGHSTMGANTVARAFRSAIDDEMVQAILFRVDSPGGSYVGSDLIWREVMRAKDHGKPVVVSMGDVAGSGGYFVSMGADKIIAQPATITGSIGVVAGKFLTRGFWEKVGVSWGEINGNPNASFWSSLRDYTPSQWERLQEQLDTVYDDFLSKLARGRNLSKEKALQAAKGRVWTGKDAKEIGLVDELGGYNQALRTVRELADVPRDAEVRLKVFPEVRSPVFRLLQRFLGEGEPDEDMAGVVEWLRSLRILQPLLQWMQYLDGPDGVLSMRRFKNKP